MYNGYGNYNNYGNYGGYPSNNPLQSQIDRLNQMQQIQQMQLGQQQPMQGQINNQQSQQVLPVGGIEEVKAHQVDWTGKPNYFIDNANEKIYIKQLSMEGVPIISTYSLDKAPQDTKVEYCTREEFNGLKSELDEYKNILNDLLSKLRGDTNE